MGSQARNTRLVRSAAEQALAGRAISERTLKLLREQNLLKDSTRFRCNSQFPGERQTLQFEYNVANPHNPDGYDKVAGFIGFDVDFQLLSIDQRAPDRAVFYKQRNRWVRQ